MKKIFNLIIIALIVICLIGCDKAKENNVKEEISTIPGAANPMVEYESLDEINGVAKTKLIKAPVSGVADEKFFVISDEIAHYVFSINGIEYVFRGSKNIDKDISGVWIGEKTAFDGSTENFEIVMSDEIKCSKMLVKDTLYTLVANDNGSLTEEQFSNIANEFRLILLTNASNDNATKLVGDYMDRVSQRAICHISLVGVDELYINITWGSSANSHDEWQINAKYENNQLVYGMSDINHLHYDGNDEAIQVNDAIGGYFEIKDEIITWIGSGIESTSSCEFEKVEIMFDSKQ